MEAQEGSTSRFGALATGLAQLSVRYQLLTPPYIILLCRTFLLRARSLRAGDYGP